MTTNKPVSTTTGPLSIFSGKTSTYLLRLLALAFIDAIAVWLIGRMYADGVWQLATVLLAITVLMNAVFLREELYPLRWMSPGIALMILMVIYPIIFTVYIAFTNFSTGHLLTKEQAIDVLGQTRYLPENAVSYEWVGYRSTDGTQYMIALIDDAGTVTLARPGEAPVPVVSGENGVGALDENGVPQTIEGYTRLARRDVVPVLSDLNGLEFGVAPGTVRISTVSSASQAQQRYVYDNAQGTLTDQQTGTVYRADESQGSFVSTDGQVLTPGYRVEIGFKNFERIFNNPALRGPFVTVFIWTFVFAILSVLMSFSLGLALALVFNDPNLPARKLIRTLLIIPYTIPAVISVLIWRGLFNPQFGIINEVLGTIGLSPDWLNDPTMAKVAILMINLWLGYPYMMLVSSGALQSIPSDVYEASAIDGASESQSFWGITLPLLLVSLGPLLISSFAFNLNNFNLIFLFNEGGPPISGSPTPAGHTDILISYTYRLAFAGGRGADYGFASAITIIIFFLVALITFFNFRYTGALEEVN